MNFVALLSRSFLLTNLRGKEKRLRGRRHRHCSRAKENLQAGASFCVSTRPLPTTHLFSAGSLLQTKLKFD